MSRRDAKGRGGWESGVETGGVGRGFAEERALDWGFVPETSREGECVGDVDAERVTRQRGDRPGYVIDRVSCRNRNFHPWCRNKFSATELIIIA